MDVFKHLFYDIMVIDIKVKNTTISLQFWTEYINSTIWLYLDGIPGLDFEGISLIFFKFVVN